MKKIICNINLNNKLVSNIDELYFYNVLRMFAHNYGGSFKSFKFTKQQRYVGLKKLIDMGLVKKDFTLVKYRDVLEAYDCANYNFYLTEDHLASIYAFKGAIIASSEAYIISLKDKLKKQDTKHLRPSDRSPLNKTKEIIMNGVNCIAGRAFNVEVERLTGLSAPTVSRWRRFSKEFKFNFYKLKTINCQDKNATKYIGNRLDTGVSFFYSPKNKTFYTKDLAIYTPIEVFHNKAIINYRNDGLHGFTSRKLKFKRRD